MKKDGEIVPHKIAPKKTICENGICMRFERAIVELIIGKIQNSWMGPEIFD